MRKRLSVLSIIMCVLVVSIFGNFTTVSAKSKVYKEGNYTVGKNMTAGEYVATADEDYIMGGYVVYTDKSKEDRVCYENVAKGYDSIVTVEKGDYVEIEGVVFTPIASKKLTINSTGYYKVGKHIKAGKYKATVYNSKDETTSKGYYDITNYNQRYRGYEEGNKVLSGKLEKGVNNSDTITLESGQYIELTSCKLTKVK